MSSTLKSLRALADPMRLRIVALLEKDELSVNEFQEVTRLGQSRISTHLEPVSRRPTTALNRGGICPLNSACAVKRSARPTRREVSRVDAGGRCGGLARR